jgi:hypothetical protein
MLVLTLVFFTIILGLGGLHNREVSWHLQSKIVSRGRNGSVQQTLVACGVLAADTNSLPPPIGYILTIPSAPMATIYSTHSRKHTAAL